MIIKRIKIENFRNIKSAELLFSNGTNIITGRNAQGKTNLVEALSIAMDSVFRRVKNVDYIPYNSESKPTKIVLVFEVDSYKGKENLLECEITEKKLIRVINEVSYKKSKELYPQLKAITFIPEDLEIVKSSPDKRRAVLDDTAELMNKKHHSVVADYFRALKQKNSCLAGDGNSQNDLWNEQLARLGVNVMCGRRKYFNTLSSYAAEYYSELNSNGEQLEIKYLNSVLNTCEEKEKESPEFLFDRYLDALNASYVRDCAIGYTTVGVHRDELLFFINGNEVKTSASQGQIRSIVISLRLAQARMFKEKWNDSPIIILDDVLSELDEGRREFVLRHIVNSQVFITGCNTADFEKLKNYRIWTAENGEFRSYEQK